MADEQKEQKQEVNYIIRHSMIPAFLAVAFTELGVIVVTIFIIIGISILMPTFQSLIVLMLFIAFMILTLYVGIHLYDWANSYYVVGTGAIFYMLNHIFKKDEVFYTINENADCILAQSFTGKLFRYGTIVVTDPTGREKIFLVNVVRPQIAMNAIMEMINKMRSERGKGGSPTMIGGRPPTVDTRPNPTLPPSEQPPVPFPT